MLALTMNTFSSTFVLVLLVRFSGYIRGDVHYCSERQPDCRRAAADHQQLDPDAEKGTQRRRFGDVLPELGGLS